MSYATLSEDLEQWLNREGFTTLTDQTETLIAMGQRRIHRECDLNAMEEVSSLTIDASTEAVPADFLRVKSITIQDSSNNYPVKGHSHQGVMSHQSTGRPLNFSVIGTNFHFGPSPDQEYTAQLVYYKKLDILSTSNTTNWISENEPELLLFAALLEACLFLKDDKRAAVWEGRYNQVKDSIARSEERMDKPSGDLQVKAM